MSVSIKITLYSQSRSLLAPDFQLQPKGCASQSSTKIVTTLRPIEVKFL